MKKKILLITIPIIALLLVAIGVLTYILLATPQTKGMYLEHVRTAERMLQNGDADQAILYYKSAITEDDSHEEPYLALATIYYEQKNDIKMALDILFEGYGKVGSVELYNAIQKYLALSDAAGKPQETGPADTDLKKGVITSSYINTFSSYTYQSYKDHYTVVSEHNYSDSYTVSYTQFKAEFEYRNSDEHPHIVDPQTGKPYPNSRPTAIRVNGVDTLISGVSEGVTVDDLRAAGAHDLYVNNPGNGFSTKYISFVYGNCKCYVECDDNGVIKNVQAMNYIVPPMSLDVTKATLAGTVVNADNNKLIKDVTLNIRKGKGKKTGFAEKTVEAADGEFSIELDPGDYTVEAIANGFITDYYDCSLPEAGDTVNQQFVMSPKLQENQMRFVVEWTNTQYDLYIHIKGRSSTDENIQYWEYGSSSGNVSQNIGGFETGSKSGYRYTSATITDSLGNYEFHVHGGKDQYSKDVLYKANVVVKIYKDNDSSPTVVDLPANIPLKYWQVCRVHDGEITMID
ncbi:carboxypeptidase regulatory-like domain-containing protein [Ruminococcus sp.]|uniref:carboxypeptidase regulatory-like domain-containing protein n=1 Tax=Ruminococcus sp. TaxID=41978 RepID=UPI00388ED35D